MGKLEVKDGLLFMTPAVGCKDNGYVMIGKTIDPKKSDDGHGKVTLFI